MQPPFIAKKPQGRRDRPQRLNPLSLALLAALACVPGVSGAQDARPDPPSAGATAAPAGGDAPELAGVTVTARRAEERAKDVPLGIGVIDGEEIEARRQPTLEEALRGTPGVNVWSDGSPHSANVLIRGTGSINPVSTDDGAVALSVDGVPMSVRNMSLGTLDVERVEILKGPQGTLFGSNSRAGAINVITNQPTRNLEGYVRGEIGQDGQHLEEAVISGPLSQSLSGRLAIRNSGSDHWVDNARTSEPLSKPRSLMFRGSLLWDGGPGTNALFVAEREETKRSPGLVVLRPYGDPPSMDVTPGLFDHNAKLVERYSVTINHDLPVGRLTSVTGYTKFDTDFVGGYDARAMQAMFGMPAENMQRSMMGGHTTSQDLRWSSRPGASVFWVAGVNLSRAERSFEQLYLSRNFGIDRRYETDSQALYGEVTWPLTNVLKLTGGMRHTWDRKSYDATYGGTVPDARKLRDDYSTGRVALSYALTPTTNLYGAWSRGYESGGIGDHPTQVADSVPYKAASTNAVEVGFKMESASRRFALNGALFATRVKDDHLLGFDAATLATSTVNADTQSRGAELQGVWRLGNGFSLSGGVSVIDAEITSNVSGVSGGAIRKGNRSPDVPKWSGSLGVAYTQRLSAFMGLPTPVLNARLDYQYVGTRAADPQNHFDLKKYQKVDLRIGVVSGGTEVYVFGSNLLDERYDLYGFAPTATAYVGAPARGRTLGVGFRYDF
ncbi:TonB-dependent receptor [Verminephrobacter eiseniae]|uniref:TonB-dependent receptor n=1 Tax=Verminephrobacter eiseniae TaxID=364317 RepID=UPI0000DCE815|nr:TonB-dependent receptor [Verminephrobacter eiseniae]